MLKVTFLGTGGSTPTPERASPSVAVRLSREIILFDCGEGTQRQMVAAHIGFNKISRILITHLHGDHILGLPGLLQSMALQRREQTLEVYGPKGTHSFLQSVSSVLGGPAFPVNVNEIQSEGTICDVKGYMIQAIEADHGINSWSFSLAEKPRAGRFHPDKAITLGVPEGILWKRLQNGEDLDLDGRLVLSSQVVDKPRKGRVIVFSGDTRPSDKLLKLAIGADLLIHEATFGDELAERAYEDGHSTVSQAAEIGKKACVKMLVLSHISSRYSNIALLRQAAEGIFPGVVIAEDLMKLMIPFT